MFLPLVAPCQEPWALEWLSLRRHLGLCCSGDLATSPLLPELAADGSLLQTNMDSATPSRWLRCILSRQPGCNHDRLLSVSSQGLKATCLSWCMKYAVSNSDQTLLGYHSKGNSGSALSYGRDALAGPLRTLEGVLKAVRDGRFKPDAAPGQDGGSHQQTSWHSRQPPRQRRQSSRWSSLVRRRNSQTTAAPAKQPVVQTLLTRTPSYFRALVTA